MSVVTSSFDDMEYIQWINKLRAWGIGSVRPDSKVSLAFFFAWTLIKWLLIAAGIFVSFIFYVLFAVLFGAMKGK